MGEVESIKDRPQANAYHASSMVTVMAVYCRPRNAKAKLRLDRNCDNKRATFVVEGEVKRIDLSECLCNVCCVNKNHNNLKCLVLAVYLGNRF
jgi:hypothetical protein